MATQPLSRFAVLHGNHLREHRPRMYRELQQSGQLNQYLHDKGEEVGDLIAGLVEKGVPWLEAWELAKDLVYPPTEADVPNL
jgi:hypothetical protein